VHGGDGLDFAFQSFTEDKQAIYGAYLALVRKSLEVSYPYDIVGHLGYIARYVPFEDKSFVGFEKEIDDILLTIIQKGKILEVNTAVKGLKQATLPSEDILKRYFSLGGRMVSLGSDASGVDSGVVSLPPFVFSAVQEAKQKIMMTARRIAKIFFVIGFGTFL
jgi:HisJ family histidinol phosphate phosphatase